MPCVCCPGGNRRQSAEPSTITLPSRPVSNPPASTANNPQSSAVPTRAIEPQHAVEQYQSHQLPSATSHSQARTEASPSTGLPQPRHEGRLALEKNKVPLQVSRESNDTDRAVANDSLRSHGSTIDSSAPCSHVSGGSADIDVTEGSVRAPSESTRIHTDSSGSADEHR
ncbi:hypothetical protein CC80DRAFT_501109 [Byssothecium circinans]|uniref:Uncharacterized protein n=1 Tax=Byssothecium circinans TaxID=147558 RepID=A0A6A5U833_9PLEO|nr:hypothetical protein CC80DRAFT_501109 [Byssothecium circinans]